MIKNGRGTGLNIMILLLTLSNTFGAWQLLSDPRRFSALFSPFSSGQIRLVAIIPLISLLALAGISFGLLYYFYRRSPVFNKKAQVN